MGDIAQVVLASNRSWELDAKFLIEIHKVQMQWT